MSLRISIHAARRWMQRTGLRDPEAARAAWDETISKAAPAEPKPKWRLKQLLNHAVRPATYLMNDPWVFVVADGVVVTVHDNKADRFQKTPTQNA